MKKTPRQDRIRARERFRQGEIGCGYRQFFAPLAPRYASIATRRTAAIPVIRIARAGVSCRTSFVRKRKGWEAAISAGISPHKLLSSLVS
jgi:hypothetical protein